MTTVRVKGLRELDRALAELPKSTGKAVLRRVLRASAEPMLFRAARRAPVDSLDLVESMGISGRLSKRQAAMHRKMFRNDRASVEMFLGAGKLPQAHLQEFGTSTNDPQPFLRPAWDAEKRATLDRIVEGLKVQIAKAAERLARKNAKAGK